MTIGASATRAREGRLSSMTGPRHQITRAQAKVWALVAGMTGAATLLAVFVLAGMQPLDPAWRLPWWVMAPVFWAAEAQVIHFHFRRGAHTFSLNELPLVVGFFLASPLELVIAQAIGSAAALAINRHQPPVKLAFNIGSFALSSVVGLIVFRVIGVGPLTDPMRWFAAFTAVSISNLVGVVTVATAISISEGSLGLRKLRQMVAVSSVVAITNTSIALLAVIIIVADSRAVWLLTLPIATLFLGYRAFIGAKQQHESLELLYESTRILQRTPEIGRAHV